MKLFLYKSVALFIVVTILFKLLDVLAVSGLSNLKDDDYKDLDLLYNNKIDDELLILGSSRAWNHFDIKVIEEQMGIKSRVIGLSGADFNMQRALWEQALNSENNVKYIVHVVGALEFSKREDGIFKKYKFFPYFNSQYVYSNLSNIQPDLWKDKYVPLYKFHGNYKYFLKGIKSKFKPNTSSLYTKYKGYRGFEDVWDGEIKVDSKVISQNDISLATSFLREEAQLANEKGKVLIIVYAPEFSQTNAIFKGKQTILNKLESVASANDNVYFFNYNEWEGNRDVKLFHNATHLNAVGAKLFSQSFVKDLTEVLDINN
ncbi:hypothetical protein [Winogradskyella sp. Asnod2-B02-A]|uniref:hypothetical protein n=1 Tax=Winogradskyella sp. Asnod2-B02-A TaxID=3160583 RepID=UPI00386AFEC5